MSEMTFSANGRQFIESIETFQRHAYKPTPDDVPTIGFGHTKGVRLGDTCTTLDADSWLSQDIQSAVEIVNGFLASHPRIHLSQSYFDALVSLIFNCGPDPLRPDYAISKALSLASGPDYYAAWRAFSLWINQAGKPLRGLAIRRAKEMALALSEPFPSQ